jgi:hypothetical protein
MATIRRVIPAKAQVDAHISIHARRARSVLGVKAGPASRSRACARALTPARGSGSWPPWSLVSGAGRRAGSAHQRPWKQDAASGWRRHPKGRSAAEQPQSGLTTTARCGRRSNMCASTNAQAGIQSFRRLRPRQALDPRLLECAAPIFWNRDALTPLIVRSLRMRASRTTRGRLTALRRRPRPSTRPLRGRLRMRAA